MTIQEAFKTGTITKTLEAIIAGKKAKVEQVLGTRHRQDIFYRIDGVLYESEVFWGLNPVLLDDAGYLKLYQQYIQDNSLDDDSNSLTSDEIKDFVENEIIPNLED